MNHIIKPFRPYFNTPLDPRRAQGMIAYYDATTQQGGGYLADKVGNRHGVFANNPTWRDGNSVYCNKASSQYIFRAFPTVAFPYTVLFKFSLPVINTDDVWVGVPSFSIFGGIGISSESGTNLIYSSVKAGTTFNTYYAPASILTIGKEHTIACVYSSSTSGQFYVDNQLYTTKSDAGWLSDTGYLAIGCRYRSGSFSKFSSVYIKQLAIFNRALTHSEILAHYQDPYYFYERPKIYGFVSSGSYNGSFVGASALVGGGVLCGQGNLIN